jgi:hypothetical protein
MNKRFQPRRFQAEARSSLTGEALEKVVCAPGTSQLRLEKPSG